MLYFVDNYFFLVIIISRRGIYSKKWTRITWWWNDNDRSTRVTGSSISYFQQVVRSWFFKRRGRCVLEYIIYAMAYLCMSDGNMVFLCMIDVMAYLCMIDGVNLYMTYLWCGLSMFDWCNLSILNAFQSRRETQTWGQK